VKRADFPEKFDVVELSFACCFKGVEKSLQMLQLKDQA
jgi:hypothetical protein